MAYYPPGSLMAFLAEVPDPRAPSAIQLSVVIPVFNEAATVQEQEHPAGVRSRGGEPMRRHPARGPTRVRTRGAAVRARVAS